MEIYRLNYGGESFGIPHETKKNIENESYYESAKLKGTYVSLCKAVIDQKERFKDKCVGIINHGSGGVLGSVVSKAGATAVYVVSSEEDGQRISRNHTQHGGLNYRCVLFNETDPNEMFDYILLCEATTKHPLSDVLKYIKMHLYLNGDLFCSESDQEGFMSIRKDLSFRNSNILSNDDHMGNTLPVVVMNKFKKE